MGGETRFNENIRLLLEDIQYTHNLLGRDIFEYNPQTSGYIVGKITASDVHILMLRMQNDDVLEIKSSRNIETALSKYARSSPPSSHSNTSLESDRSLLHHTLYTLDVSETDFKGLLKSKADNHKSLLFTVSFQDPDLKLSINNSEPITIASPHGDRGPHSILTHIFNTPNIKIPRIEITNTPSRESLERILVKSGYRYLVEFGLVSGDKSAIILKKRELKLSPEDAKKFVSKIVEKYRKDAELLLEKYCSD
ncbi:MAG: hypothetical protein UY35_C0001G0023 [Candidatus Saccharibacteria bacterium GW2011_GWC2_48_9]|nr:MAG: hypothetical protein UY35_C0001G0023 [Candidatus Saccharibacteria bacterium GW2011_GWC2_48_9]HCH34396.1 hypothetical protein [Candidatus Saccharibacteria bacterium]